MSKRTRLKHPNLWREKVIQRLWTTQAADTRIEMQDGKVYRWQADGSLRFVGVA